MTDTFFPASAFGTYTHAVAVGATAQAEIVANIISLAGLMGATMAATGLITNYNAPRSTGASAAPPNFDHIPEATRRLILNELSAIAVGVEATATS
jgi:hypothetical protein